MAIGGDAVDDRPEARELLANLKRDHDELAALLDRASDHPNYEDAVYRFWHQSFKVYAIQGTTGAIAAALRGLAPDGRPLNPWFEQIVGEGTGQRFEPQHNSRWLEVTRPMLEAFFHARFMLEMAVRYGRELDRPPAVLPSGWAALLYLYDLR